MKNVLSFVYSLVAYLAFVATFGAMELASTGLLRAFVPAVDDPPRHELVPALAIDVALVLAFGVQHTVMARASFKRWLERFVPQRLERSTFVLVSSICTGAIAFAWAPIGGDLWDLREKPVLALAVQALALAGFGLALVSSFAFDHFGLFGLRQGRTPEFRTPALYRIVRHPMMLGILLGVWAAPHMTVGHLVFATTLTAYVVVGIHFEERSLLRELGERYARYQAEVPMLLPWPRPAVAERLARGESVR